MRLESLRIADPPERWAGLGFSVRNGAVAVGDVTLELGVRGEGITAWSLPPVDGLLSFEAVGHLEPARHPNGSSGIDHVVILTPDFDRTSREFQVNGLGFKRIRDAGGFRQGFRRAGSVILEVVESKGEPESGPARFWGLVVVVEDLGALKERLGDLLSEPKPAVQPGRRIATLHRDAGLSAAVAFMTA